MPSDEEEYVVTPIKRDQQMLESPATIKVITKEEIECYGYETLGELLRAQHEIDIINNSVFTTVSIRGCSGVVGSERILVLVNGRPVNTVITGSIEPCMIKLDNVERVEIMRSPCSAVYGANAFAGVINIITTLIQDTTLGITSVLSGETMIDKNSYSESKTSTGHAEFCRIIYNNQVDDTVGFSIASSYLNKGGAISNAELENKTVALKVKLIDIKNTDVILYMGTSEGRMGLPKYDISRDITGTYRMTGKLSITSKYLDMIYRRLIDPVSDITIRLYRELTEFEFQLPVLRLLPDGSKEWQEEYPVYPETLTGLEVQYNWLVNEQNFITTGIDVKHEITEVSHYIKKSPGLIDDVYYDSVNKRYTSNTKAIYIHNEYKPNSQLTLTSGLRYDYQSIYKDIYSPRVAVIYRLKDKPTVLRCAVARAFRVPNIAEQYSQQYFGSVLVQKTPSQKSLSPETIIGYEAGISHQFRDDDKIEVIVFKNEMDNLIDAPYTMGTKTMPVRREYINQGSAETKGIEITLQKNFPEQQITGILNYTYMDTCFTTSREKKKMPYIPENKLTLKLEYMPKDTLHVGVKVTWVGKRMSAVNKYLDTSEDISELPAYSVVDTYLRWRLNNTTLLHVVINNLFDTDYKTGPGLRTTYRRAIQIGVNCNINFM
jgi:outer membrane receptor for ferrienterochelin and colicin